MNTRGDVYRIFDNEYIYATNWDNAIAILVLNRSINIVY